MRQTACVRRSLAGMIGGGTRGREPHVRHEAAGVHQRCSAARRRRGRSRRARSSRADAAHRRSDRSPPDDPESQARIGAFLQELAELGLDRRPQRRDRNRWADGDARRLPATRPNWSPSRPTSSSPTAAPRCCWPLSRRPAPCRSCSYSRRSGGGFRRQPGAAGRQRHRLHCSSPPWRKVAGTAQGDRAGRDARAVIRNPGEPPLLQDSRASPQPWLRHWG